MDGDQRGRAGGLDGDARPFQIELVRDPRRQQVASLPISHLELADESTISGLGNRLFKQVGAHAGAGVNADQPRVGLRVVAGVLQRLPGAFEEQAVLRVHQSRPRAA